jgi:hypothetical protein
VQAGARDIAAIVAFYRDALGALVAARARGNLRHPVTSRS